jgi:hypothetical protein
MSEPERLNRSSGLAGVLLASAKADRPARGSARRILAGAAVGAAIATKSSSSVASTVAAILRWTTWTSWKAVAVGVAGVGSVVAVGAAVVSRPEPPPAIVAPAPAPAPVEPVRHGTGRVGARAPVSPPVESSAPVASAVEPPPVPPLVARSAPPVATTPPPAPQGSRLAAQIAAIDDAKRTLAAGDADGALRRVDAYDRAFPQGTLAAEASALRVEALARAGRLGEAREALARFRASYPGSPLLERLASVVPE